MLDGEELFAFLDDVYIVSSPERTRHLYNLVAEKLWFVAGLQLHTGKTLCWNQIGMCPPDMVDLGPEVWSSFEYIKEVGDRRLEEEQRLWDAIPWIPDLQCAWQVFLQGAGPPCHHFLRTSHSAVLWSVPLATTWACNARWTRCWEDSLGTRDKSRRRRRWQRCP